VLCFGGLEKPWMVTITHRIHGAGIYGNMYHQYTPNVSIFFTAPWIRHG
jgi:hypothetical protein